MKSILGNKVQRLFIILAGFFITNALIAEFVGVKLFSLEKVFGFDALQLSLFGVEGIGFTLTVGVILWPVVFVMTDVINEYFGIRGVRFLSNLAVILIIYAFIMIYIGIGLPPDEWWELSSGVLADDPEQHIGNMNVAFRKIFGQGLWIIVGSLVAFLIGQIVDVSVFHFIKRKTGEGKVWLRATGSTLVSQFIDSFVVLLIAFYIGADWPLVRVLAIGLVSYSYKFTMAILLTPVIYGAHYLIDSYLGEELATELKLKAIGKKE
jgi:uncharacterized integral membrane protein (TIGR00697 family)